MNKSNIIFASINLLLLVFVSIHILGICSFAKSEGRNYYGFSDNFSFGFIDLPVIGFCFLLDFIWTIKAVIEIFRREYQSICVLTSVTFLWIVMCSIVWHLTML